LSLAMTGELWTNVTVVLKSTRAHTADRAYSPGFGRLLAESIRATLASHLVSFEVLLVAMVSMGFLQLTLGNGIAQTRAIEERFRNPDLLLERLVDEGSGGNFTSSGLDRLRGLTGVADAVGIGAAADVRPVVLPTTGTPVAARSFDGILANHFDLVGGRFPANDREAIAAVDSIERLGLFEGFGEVVTADGAFRIVIVGVVAPKSAIGRAVGGVVFPATPGEDRLRSIIVAVESAGYLAPVAKVAPDVVGVLRRDEVTIAFPDQLESLRLAVSRSSGRYAGAFVTIALLTSVGGVGLITALFATTRRRDFGRRRALGASRGALILLVVCQVLLPTIPGAVIGSVIGNAIAIRRVGVGVPIGFLGLSVATNAYAALVASLPAAVVAGFRDPVRVLRQP
jgi:putative ABC transport system permease protein